jgi:multimeric flavodoxin WrbA
MAEKKPTWFVSPNRTEEFYEKWVQQLRAKDRMTKREKSINVIGISGSPRKQGNTEILLGEALSSAQDMGANTELISLSGLDIRPCDACQSCVKTNVCHIKDDMQPIYEKMIAADGIILGTPVYTWFMTGQMKTMLDRTHLLRSENGNRFANKVGGAVIVTARTGFMSTAGMFYLWFAGNHMLAADWVTGFALEKGSIVKDTFAMRQAWHLGREVVLLVEKGFTYPEDYGSLALYMTPMGTSSPYPL